MIDYFELVSSDVTHWDYTELMDYPDWRDGSEVRQRLRVNADGQVTFEAYGFLDDTPLRSRSFKANKERTKAIFSLINEYFLEKEIDWKHIPDFGEWYMTISVEGKLIERSGSLFAFEKENILFTDDFRDLMKIKKLMALGGSYLSRPKKPIKTVEEWMGIMAKDEKCHYSLKELKAMERFDLVSEVYEYVFNEAFMSSGFGVRKIVDEAGLQNALRSLSKGRAYDFGFDPTVVY